MTPWTVVHQIPLSMGFSRQEYWSGLPCPLPGDLPNPGTKPRSPTFQADSLSAEQQGKPKNTGMGSLSLLQWIFPTQESNEGLLHCRQILDISQSLLKLMSTESVIPSNHLILCRPLLLPPSILPSIRVFSRVKLVAAVELCSHAAYIGLAKKFLQF